LVCRPGLIGAVPFIGYWLCAIHGPLSVRISLRLPMPHSRLTETVNSPAREMSRTVCACFQAARGLRPSGQCSKPGNRQELDGGREHLGHLTRFAPLNLSSEMVRTRSTASHSFRAKSGTRWNASLPSSGAQGGPRLSGGFSPRSSLAGRGRQTARSGGTGNMRPGCLCDLLASCLRLALRGLER
jgi:hypothetical protein